MKKTYQTPALECLSLQTTHMLAESLNKYSKGADQNVVLTREKQTEKQGGFGKGMWEDMK
ncbi:MAG: hypothetical protein SPL50_03430 [Alloprevotella sp.]|nr:hypothetical protein [Alloprevotella sp.]